MKANAVIEMGVPVATIGNDGEFYVDCGTSLIYGPKTGGEWGEGVTFQEFYAKTAKVPAEDVAQYQAAEPTPLQKLEAKIAALENDMEKDKDEVCKAANEAALVVLRKERDKLIASINAVEQDAESFWKKNKNDIISYTIIALLAISAAKSLGVL